MELAREVVEAEGYERRTPVAARIAELSLEEVVVPAPGSTVWPVPEVSVGSVRLERVHVQMHPGAMRLSVLIGGLVSGILLLI